MKNDQSKYEMITATTCIVALTTIGYLFYAISSLLVNISMGTAVFGFFLWVLVVLGVFTNVVKLIALIQERND